MAQFSGFWTTGGATGDQVAGYTQAHWSTAGSIFAACSGFEGVAPGWEATDEFMTTDAGGGNLSVGTGAAMVDGKWFENDAPVTVNIPTPAAGNARIDRIVARVVWANFTVRITRIVGTAAAIPVAPAITQTSGATYDIPLYQAYITDGGVITLTDERVFAGAQVDGVTLENAAGVLRVANGGINTPQLANDSVDDTKAGDRVPQFYRRQGGSAVSWATAGTNNYTPTAVRMQGGVIELTLPIGEGAADTTVTFPVAFSQIPIVVISANADFISDHVFRSAFITAADFHINVYGTAPVGGDAIFNVHWLAIGAE